MIIYHPYSMAFFKDQYPGSGKDTIFNSPDLFQKIFTTVLLKIQIQDTKTV